ncbi:hypothetical protein BH23PLA1_BH23PLA1_22010 [soil metagenome]
MLRTNPPRLLPILLLSSFVCCYPAHADEIWPERDWSWAEPAEVGLDLANLEEVRDYALTGEGSGMILRSGRLVFSWGELRQRYDLKSTTKSIGVTALGLAIADGKIGLDDKARDHHPNFGFPPEENASTGWLDEITIRHLATQTAGFEKPGGYTRLVFRPGTRWQYSDSGPNWLAECVTLVYRRDVRDLMFDRVFTPIGIRPVDLTWRRNSYRDAEIDGIPRREFGSGIHANVDAMSRIGLLYLREGRWKDQQILPPEFVTEARATVPEVVGLPVEAPEDYGKASNHYGLLWWNNADGTLLDVPRDAYWSWGLYDSLIVVVPSLDLVIARAGQSWKREKGADHYDVLRPFLGAIVASVQPASAREEAPYPPSRAIVDIKWAPASEIIRDAKGSDNWPITWADDDALYTAYGDGWGFEPRVPKKLSLGLSKVVGSADDFKGINIRSETIEQVGDGARGLKASGMLMVEGILYLWARNADNSRLAWSSDHGETWEWSPWRFETSFGAPTFLNFGKNYEGARDDYVYIYSHDNDSAYEPADRMILSRVPKDKIRERGAFEFLEAIDDDGQPRWTSEIDRRGTVFRHPGRCYRSGITYNAGLGRYLWCQTLPEGDARFEGGFGIYEAPEPWGPWRTVFFTEAWDVGPGETCHFPTKWMSDDGKTLHLVFSGDDCFSVRRADLILGEGR